jgi:hypothetical protein
MIPLRRSNDGEMKGISRAFHSSNHSGLVERRLKVGPSAEHEKSQRIIQMLAAILWCALIIVPGIE